MEAKKEDWERGGNVGKKLFVVEARRVLPLLFLLVLLISLSVYDSFRVSPTVKPEDVAAKGQVNFTTADKGEMKENPSFRIAPCQASWAAVVDEWSIVLPQLGGRQRKAVGVGSFDECCLQSRNCDCI